MTSVAVLMAMVKLVVRMVDFISQMSGLTSALYRHAVSHTNCNLQIGSSSVTALPALPAPLLQASVQAGSVIRHISCNADVIDTSAVMKV